MWQINLAFLFPAIFLAVVGAQRSLQEVANLSQSTDTSNSNSGVTCRHLSGLITPGRGDRVCSPPFIACRALPRSSQPYTLTHPLNQRQCSDLEGTAQFRCGSGGWNDPVDGYGDGFDRLLNVIYKAGHHSRTQRALRICDFRANRSSMRNGIDARMNLPDFSAELAVREGHHGDRYRLAHFKQPDIVSTTSASIHLISTLVTV